MNISELPNGRYFVTLKGVCVFLVVCETKLDTVYDDEDSDYEYITYYMLL